MSDYITKDMLAAMLSSLDVDSMASIIVKATLRDISLPMQAVNSLLNLCSTVATMMDANDRAIIVEKMRRISDILERDLLPPPGNEGR